MRISNIKKVYFNLIPNLFVILGLIFLFMSFGPLVIDEVWFTLKELKSQEYILSTEPSGGAVEPNAVEDSVFARFLSTRPVKLNPVNTDFGLVVERIGVNTPVIKDVTVTNQEAYIASLKNGVAHAITSDYPSEKPGNVYIFAHASLNFWELGKYATTFNLLRKLELKDRIHLFYEGKTYVYEVVNKEIYEGWNTYPLTRPVIEPLLTLQTCDPPGTTLNRLVVTSELIDVL